MRYFFLSVTLLLSFIATSQNYNSQAQTTKKGSSISTLDVIGGDAASAEGSISYSIGQVFYASANSSEISLLEGVQQPLIITPETTTPVPNKGSLEIIAYPNPMEDHFYIELRNFENAKLSYELFDLNGRLIEANSLEMEKTKVAPRFLNSALYLLKISDHGQHLKTFKIIKR